MRKSENVGQVIDVLDEQVIIFEYNLIRSKNVTIYCTLSSYNLFLKKVYSNKLQQIPFDCTMIVYFI